MYTLQITGFEKTTTSSKLREAFSSFGRITKYSINEVNDAKIGFITYENRQSALKATKFCHGKNMLGGILQVQTNESKKGQKDYPGNIYIKNLDVNINEEQLKREFSIFGNIKSVKILKGQHNKSIGSAFLCFESIEVATRAVIIMNKKLIGSKRILIEFAKSTNAEKQDRDLYVKKLFDIGSKFDDRDFTYLLSMSFPSTSKNMTQDKVFESLNYDPLEGTSNNGQNEGNKIIFDDKIKIFEEVLNHLPIGKQKGVLQKLMLPQIKSQYKESAGKIINFLLRLEVSELVKMFRNSTVLTARCDAILGTLRISGDECY